MTVLLFCGLALLGAVVARHLWRDSQRPGVDKESKRENIAAAVLFSIGCLMGLYFAVGSLVR